MFYSLMAILHEKLPPATNFFRLKKRYREMRRDTSNHSPVRTIASPKMIRGLSISKRKKGGADSDKSPSPNSPEIRIKNLRQSELSRRQSINSRLSS
jgi:hypothetical protein